MIDKALMMPSNVSQFELCIVGMPANLLTVQKFSSHEYALSKAYYFVIHCISSQPLTAAMLLLKQADLCICWGNEQIKLHGVIEQLILVNVDKTSSRYAYQIRFASPMSVLANQQKTRIFLQQTIPAIVAQIVRENQLTIVNKAHARYATLDFVLQLNETDLAFVERLLAQAGIIYFINNQTPTPEIWLLDDVTELPVFVDQQLSVISQSGQVRERETIYAFSPRQIKQIESVQLNTYHNPTPNNKLTTQQAQPTYYYFGHGYVDLAQGNHLAASYERALSCQRQTVIVETDCRGLQLGQLVQINHPGMPQYSGQYRVIAMQVEASQMSSWVGGQAMDYPQAATYRSRAQLIPANIAFCHLPQPILQTGSMVLTAGVANLSSSYYPDIDQDGRYLLNLSVAPPPANKPGSARINQVGCFAGSKQGEAQGMHFPLRAGTQVSLGFINNDFNQPIITGALPNPMQQNPVVAQHTWQHVVRSHTANELMFHDLPSAESVLFATVNRQNQIKLSNHQEIPQAYLATQGDFVTAAQDQISYYSQADMRIQAKKALSISVGKNHQLQVKQHGLRKQSGNDIKTYAVGEIYLSSKKSHSLYELAQQASLFVTQQINFQSIAGSIIIDAQQKRLQWYVDQQSIFQVDENNCLLTAGQAAVQLQPSAKAVLTANNILFNAPVINIYSETAVNS